MLGLRRLVISQNNRDGPRAPWAPSRGPGARPRRPRRSRRPSGSCRPPCSRPLRGLVAARRGPDEGNPRPGRPGARGGTIRALPERPRGSVHRGQAKPVPDVSVAQAGLEHPPDRRCCRRLVRRAVAGSGLFQRLGLERGPPLPGQILPVRSDPRLDLARGPSTFGPRPHARAPRARPPPPRASSLTPVRTCVACLYRMDNG
jgi:hypothetical protein